MFILEIPIEASSENEAREIKAYLSNIYAEFGLAGMKAMQADSQSMVGKAYTNKYRKLNAQA